MKQPRLAIRRKLYSTTQYWDPYHGLWIEARKYVTYAPRRNRYKRRAVVITAAYDTQPDGWHGSTVWTPGELPGGLRYRSCNQPAGSRHPSDRFAPPFDTAS